jgi:hypothetical protein
MIKIMAVLKAEVNEDKAMACSLVEGGRKASPGWRYGSFLWLWSKHGM